MRAAIYTRVSTSDQSPEMQILSLREFAKSRGIEIVHEACDILSGSKNDRARRTEIIRLAKSRKIDLVLVWKLDRWGRNMADVVLTLDELFCAGVSFISLQESFDFTTSIGKAMAGMLAVFAELERNMIRERVKAGVERYREKNGIWGRPATAQKFAPIIKHLAQEGKSINEIVRSAGVSRSSVVRILKKQ